MLGVYMYLSDIIHCGEELSNLIFLYTLKFKKEPTFGNNSGFDN